VKKLSWLAWKGRRKLKKTLNQAYSTIQTQDSVLSLSGHNSVISNHNHENCMDMKLGHSPPWGGGSPSVKQWTLTSI
jgi:hypothetical protein